MAKKLVVSKYGLFEVSCHRTELLRHDPVASCFSGGASVLAMKKLAAERHERRECEAVEKAEAERRERLESELRAAAAARPWWMED